MPRIRIQSINGPSASIAQVREAALAAMALIARAWHEKYLPMHFSLGAVQRYGYKPRTAKYMKRKARTQHHQRPLVLTGRSEAQARAMVTVTTRRRSGLIQSSASMQLPTYFYQYRKDVGAPNKYEELTRVIDAEADTLAAMADAEMARLLGAMHEREQTQF